MNKKKIIITLALLTTIHYSLTTHSYAINMQSDEYRIQFGKVDSGGGKMTNPGNDGYQLSSSIGQEEAKEFQSNGYIVKAGFQYIYTHIPFVFYLSTTKVDLGTLLPNTPASGDITLKVSFGTAGQYIVTARADAPLTEVQGTDIVSFTACNGGVDTCTITNAKTWTSSSAYGFGYGMTGQNIPTDFIKNTYFRPFANKLTAEDATIIMQGGSAATHQAVITMKANISGLQPAGTYTTVIRFLATPSF